MLDDIKKRFEFPNAVIQSQAVGHLIAAVLKENVSSEKIRQASDQECAWFSKNYLEIATNSSYSTGKRWR